MLVSQPKFISNILLGTLAGRDGYFRVAVADTYTEIRMTGVY